MTPKKEPKIPCKRPQKPSRFLSEVPVLPSTHSPYRAPVFLTMWSQASRERGEEVGPERAGEEGVEGKGVEGLGEGRGGGGGRGGEDSRDEGRGYREEEGQCSPFPTMIQGAVRVRVSIWGSRKCSQGQRVSGRAEGTEQPRRRKEELRGAKMSWEERGVERGRGKVGSPSDPKLHSLKGHLQGPPWGPEASAARALRKRCSRGTTEEASAVRPAPTKGTNRGAQGQVQRWFFFFFQDSNSDSEVVRCTSNQCPLFFVCIHPGVGSKTREVVAYCGMLRSMLED